MHVLRDLPYQGDGVKAEDHASVASANPAWAEYTRKLIGRLAAEQAAFNRHVAAPQAGAAVGVVRTAVHRLERAAFVGLTEEWEASLCVFHKAFGGKAVAAERSRLRDAIAEHAKQSTGARHLSGGSAAEASASGRAGGSDEDNIARRRKRLEAELAAYGFRDWMDEAVYARGEAIFRARARALGCRLKNDKAGSSVGSWLRGPLLSTNPFGGFLAG